MAGGILRESAHRGVEGHGIEQQRRDVLEDDPRLGEVGHVPDEIAEVQGRRVISVPPGQSGYPGTSRSWGSLAPSVVGWNTFDAKKPSLIVVTPQRLRLTT